MLSLREQRALPQAADLAAGAGFTALAASDQPLDVNEWPVMGLGDPPGVLGRRAIHKEDTSPGFVVAQYAVQGPATGEGLRAPVGPCRALYPRSAARGPADATYRELTVRGRAAAGPQWSDPAGDGSLPGVPVAVVVTADDGHVLQVAGPWNADVDYLAAGIGEPHPPGLTAHDDPRYRRRPR